MTERYRTWKRPRRLALLLGVIAAASLSAAAYAVFLNDTGNVNVEVTDRTGAVVDATTNGGAFISYFGDQSESFGSSGTGTFEPFVRLQGSPSEQGYNTNGTLQFDTKAGTWTHAIKVSEIPQRPCPQLAPTLTCFELFVDINESNSDKLVVLNKVEVYFTSNASLTGYPFPASAATPQYSFSGAIRINDVNQGSGRGDLRYDIPINKAGSEIDVASINCNYGNPACNTFFVLYSQWGVGGPSSSYDSEGGFEEWKVRVYPTPPDVSVAKTPDAGQVNAGSNAVFSITVTNNGPIAANNVVLTDTLPNGGLNWTVGGANAAACNSPVPGGGLLTCNFGTIPFPGSRTITLTSPTDAADCGAKPNTAHVTATDDAVAGNNSDNGQITINCAAIQILKQSTKTGNPAVKTAGAVFSVTGPGSYSATVTDNGANDEDSTIGEVCISGLAPGNYTVNETTPPPGYGDASQTDVNAVAANGTNCNGNHPTTGNSAVFTNPPLADLLVRVDGQASTEIKSSIDCGTVGSVGIPTKVDPAVLDVDNLAPQMITCTIVIDP